MPKPFGRLLTGHRVKTAFLMGWSDLSNGVLLREAAKHFDVFITIDLNIRYQQNLKTLPLPVLALVATDNDLETLTPYAPYVLRVLATLSGKPLLCIHHDGQIECVTSV